jgi:hypothetical protein
VGRYDIEANRQPKAGAAAGAVARSFCPVKALAQAVPTIRLLAGLALKLSYLWNMIYRETYD